MGFCVMRLIHFSDPHMTDLSGIPGAGRSAKRRLGRLSWRHRRRHHLRSNLDALCAAVLDLQPDLIVLTGDLAHTGLPAELVQAGDWLRGLAPPEQVLVTPGNHDLYGQDSWAACKAHWGEYLHTAGEPPSTRTNDADADHWAGFPSHRSFDDIHIFGLNSGLPTALGDASGELGAGQRQRLAKLLSETPSNALKVLALHHPPLPGVMGRRRALRDAADLQPLLADGHIVLHGHGHYNRSYAVGPARAFATGAASTADASFRRFDIQRAANGFNVYMELRSKLDGAFRLVESTEFVAATAK